MTHNQLPIYTVLGTRAQFIKMAPLLRLMRDQGMAHALIYTGQHRESIVEILATYGLPAPDIILYRHDEANTRLRFARWLFAMLRTVLLESRRILPVPGLLVVHGDTFSTWFGAWMGRRASCTVCHVESGCRSYNVLSPFPEELTRLLVFRLADVFFCADEWAVSNLRGYEGLKVNIGANTMLDGVRLALGQPRPAALPIQSSGYGVVSIHRFENIYTRRLTSVILPLLRKIARDHRLIFTLHPTTRERLHSLGIFDELESTPNIALHERFGFTDWIHLCNAADFVITDGGSNQEELSYLGVPTLLFRLQTERREGLGKNVVLSGLDAARIDDFLQNLSAYRMPPMLDKAAPSQKIVETLRSLQEAA